MDGADLPDNNFSAQTAGGPILYSITVKKLVILSALTVGIYQLWWRWRMWESISQLEGLKLRSFLRALFGIIFIYPMLKECRKYGVKAGLAPLAAGPIAAAWIILCLSSNIPGPLFMISLFSYVPLIQVQKYVNEINAKTNPGLVPDGKFSALNWAGMIVGSIITGLAVIGTFLPDDAKGL